MTGFLIRLLISSLGLWLASRLVPSIIISGVDILLFAALLLGLVNAVVRPVVVLLTLPITVLSLGIFLLVINAAMLSLVAALLEGFRVGGFFSALMGSLIVSATGWIASWYIGPYGRIQVMVVRR